MAGPSVFLVAGAGLAFTGWPATSCCRPFGRTAFVLNRSRRFSRGSVSLGTFADATHRGACGWTCFSAGSNLVHFQIKTAPTRGTILHLVAGARFVRWQRSRSCSPYWTSRW